MEEKIADYAKGLNGITFKEWRMLKALVDNKFEEEKEKSTFKLDEGTLEYINIICQ